MLAFSQLLAPDGGQKQRTVNGSIGGVLVTTYKLEPTTYNWNMLPYWGARSYR